MKTTQKQATARLFKKLSALRATLPNDERAILDSFIVVDDAQVNSRSVNKATEVEAHKMTGKAVSKATNKAVNKATEVQAHKMTGKAVSKATSKATNKATEVQAHKMTGKAVSKATNKAVNKTTPRIAFDPNTEEYKIQD